MQNKIVVSACLAGVNCRYNEKPCPDPKLISLLRDHEVVLVCPELLAGEPIPRPPCNINGDRIMGDDGKDYTEPYVKGANIALDIVLKNSIKKAYLKSGSPTCGCGKIYSPDGQSLIDGDGIFTQLLKQHDISVESSEI